MSSGSSAAAVQRQDYRPLSYSVESVALHFQLDPQATVVHNTMICTRNPRSPQGPLTLHGSGLDLLELKVDGKDEAKNARIEGEILELDLDNREKVKVEVKTRFAPAQNSTLMGLYMSNDGYFTQCEPEGFRSITWFPDRPDVMARYQVTIEADQQDCPVLLSNGNLVQQGNLPGGRHFATWDDPFPKPSYLFALVAGKLVPLERQVITRSGRQVLLQVWTDARDHSRTNHAMQSLVNAMRWDEETFGLELDLDRFMIVAVADFNMGAMENKGLNIFNSKYVLADEGTATDVDYGNIEGVVGHEYFHNWTGNRVTCRDWFQLTLKEGLTVFRDQEFSAAMLATNAGAENPEQALSARAVKRIADVRLLKALQFAEDAGPMAHPIRPDHYKEINNFYTTTVYRKGAEVIRMLHSILGAKGFRRGMDRYFELFDGQAVTCENFVGTMGEANGRDLNQFLNWYSQAGTPVLKAEGEYDAALGQYRLTVRQSNPAAPPGSSALMIPLAIGLMDEEGRELACRLDGEADAPEVGTRILEVTQPEQTFRFVDIPVPPVPSLLRNFSAPVRLELQEDDQRLALRMSRDSDPFNRWDAASRYAERVLLQMAGPAPELAKSAARAFAVAMGSILQDSSLHPAFRAQAMTLPDESYLMGRMSPADPSRLRRAFMNLTSLIGEELFKELVETWNTMGVKGPYRYHPDDAGKRSLRGVAIRYLGATGHPEGLALLHRHLEEADNMTDRMSGLGALVQGRDSAAAAPYLERFYRQHQDNPLVLDKWFALQAAAWRWSDNTPAVLEKVRALTRHPSYSQSNPNKVYSLLGTFFRLNGAEFHLPDGSGYEFWADQVLGLDSGNPQVAARLARMLENWTIYPIHLQEKIEPALRRLMDAPSLSRNVSEVVERALSAKK